MPVIVKKGSVFVNATTLSGTGSIAKLAWIEVLHDIWIAKLGEIGDGVDIIGKIRAIFQTKPVSPGRNTLPRDRRLIQVRVLILNVKGFYPRLTVLVLAVINNGIEADGGSTTSKVIEPEAPLDVVRDRKIYLSQEGWSPVARVCG